MLKLAGPLILICIALTIGCPAPQSDSDDQAGIGADDGGQPGTGDSGTDGSAGGTDGSAGGTDGSATGLSLSGRIQAADSAKLGPRALETDAAFAVVAQSAETGQVYRAATDADGGFQLDLPESEEGNALVVTVVAPDGRAVGPVVLGQNAADEGFTGLEVARDVALGTITIPDDPAAEPLAPGSDGDVTGEDVADDVTARLNDEGVPVGVGSVGKGAEAAGSASSDPRLANDADRDGLIDLFDADNDGDGTVDDFDSDAAADRLAAEAGVHLNFFMNLKIAEDRADVYYSGTADQIADALETDTIITFEVQETFDATRHIRAVRLLPRPGPDYIELMERMTDGASGLSFVPWSESDYAFEDAGDRFQAFVRPNAPINAGDSFTVQVDFDDGSSEQFSRMINYVFRNIPRLVQHGAPVGTPTDYAGGTVAFDGSQDLLLVIRPPTDETGAALTGFDYHFEMFYNDAGGGQLNSRIDAAATFPAPPAGFDTSAFFYVVRASDLTAADDGTYVVTLPREIFVDTVQTTDGSSQAVARYKIDIAAQSNGNNAAIMLLYEKQ